MLEKLRKRFFRIALIAMTAAMVLVTTAINVINWADVRADLTATLRMLAENEAAKDTGEGRETMEDREVGPAGENEAAKETGEDREAGAGAETGANREDEAAREIPGPFPPANRSRHEENMLRESRFFVALRFPDGSVTLPGPQEDSDLSSEEALTLARQAAEAGGETGRIGDYFYLRFNQKEDGSCGYVLMNAETRLRAVNRLVLFSLCACAAGILLAMIAVSRFSRRAMEPLRKNSEEQKQFITDASHELKTPLTVISANMDVLSLDVPDNAWIRSTQKQVAQMRRLVDELVYLSRMEEANRPLETRSLELAPLLEDVAEPFAAMAEFQGKRMEIRAEEGLRVLGEEDALRRLISTLCDNAVKYAPPEGSITAEIRKEGQKAELRFANTVSEPLTEEQCQRLFQRFYRTDASRNKEKKNGFGIGLAIAAAIAEKHGGRIGAKMEEGQLVISCLLPLET